MFDFGLGGLVCLILLVMLCCGFLGLRLRGFGVDGVRMACFDMTVLTMFLWFSGCALMFVLGGFG